LELNAETKSVLGPICVAGCFRDGQVGSAFRLWLAAFVSGRIGQDEWRARTSADRRGPPTGPPVHPNGGGIQM